MKLRLRGDSVRLRLTAGEVDRLVATGRVEEKSALGQGADGTLTYAVELASGRDAVWVTFAAGELLVRVPEERGRRWAAGDEVGLYSPEDAAGATVAVEKDFRCLTPREGGEDASDAYPHPAESSGGHRC